MTDEHATRCRSASPQRVVLLGGGHAHVIVLEALARRRLAGVAITVVGPTPHTTYTGMIPGVLAGLYRPHDAQIDVAALTVRAGATFLADRAVAIDPVRRAVRLAGGDTLAFDVLAIDVGSRPRGAGEVAGFPHVVPIKPVEEALPRIDDFISALRPDAPGSAVVVGAGAGGVEIAFALRRRMSAPDHRVTLLEGGATLLGGAPARLRTLVARRCAAAVVEVRTGVGIVSACDGGVRLGDGTKIAAGLVVWATGAESLPFLRASGLPTDDDGFLLVDDELRVLGQTSIFATGDCSRLVSATWVPRAGVYAVRQGPILARNLVSTTTGAGTLASFRPQRRFLKLLSTADRRAILSYGALASHGRAWWWLKDRIDRRFVARFASGARQDRPRTR